MPIMGDSYSSFYQTGARHEVHVLTHWGKREDNSYMHMYLGMYLCHYGHDHRDSMILWDTYYYDLSTWLVHVYTCTCIHMHLARILIRVNKITIIILSSYYCHAILCQDKSGHPGHLHIHIQHISLINLIVHAWPSHCTLTSSMQSFISKSLESHHGHELACNQELT